MLGILRRRWLSRLVLVASDLVVDIVLLLRLSIRLDKSGHAQVFCAQKRRYERLPLLGGRRLNYIVRLLILLLWLLLLLRLLRSGSGDSVLIDLILNIHFFLSLSIGLYERGHAKILGS